MMNSVYMKTSLALSALSLIWLAANRVNPSPLLAGAAAIVSLIAVLISMKELKEAVDRHNDNWSL